MEPRFPELFLSAKKAVAYSQVKPDEKVVVFTDSGKNAATVDAFFTAAAGTGADVVLVKMQTRDRPLREPPVAAVQAMAAADVVFDLATHPWLYTQATNTILNSGTRMLQVFVDDDTLVKRPPEEFIARRERAARAILEQCETFRITSPYGTDILMERGDRPVHTQGGFVDHPGDWDSLGVNLAAFAPPENKANGKLAFYGTMYLPPQHIFITEEPIMTVVEEGRITHVEANHREARIFDEWLRRWDDPNSYVIAHTGFGIDHRAELHPPDPGAWESYMAGVNIAFGGNNIPQLAGKTVCQSHMDCVLLGVDLEINGQKIIERGSFVSGLGLD